MASNIVPIHAELVVDARCEIGESLIWHAVENALYWVDIHGKRLHRYIPATAQHQVWNTPEMLGCIAIHHAGGLITAAESGIFKIDFDINSPNQNPRFTWLESVSHTVANMRFNDGRCDRQGRFLAGTMTVNQAVGIGNPSIYQFTQDKLATVLTAFVKPFTTPNGMAFSPDGRTYYLSDSHVSQQRVWTFEYDIATGVPHNCREFIDMNLYSGRPDGAAIDTDGCYWICATDAGLIHRFTPQGKLDYSLSVPIKKPTICTWGGADLRTLYVASIRPNELTFDLSDQPLAGAVFAFEGLGAQGVLETPFAG